MGTHVLMDCRMRAHCRAQPPRRHGIASRITTLALALCALALVLSGEHWVLEEAPPAANELTLATCVLEDVYGDIRPAAVCVSPDQPQDQGHAP